jgi:periplasmic protein TonB
MSHYQSLYSTSLSANDAFKVQYPRYIKAAILAALCLTALFVWLWPGYEAEPYQLREKEEMVWVELEDPVDVIKPPAPIAPPRIIPDITVAKIGDPDIIDIDWPDNGFWDPVPVAPVDPSIYNDFVSSSALPQLKFQAKADYPEIARRMRVEGTVMVHVLVGPSGGVDQAVIMNSVHPTLDRAALVAAKKCRFTPAKQRQLKVKAWVAIPFRFKMN